MSKFSRRSNELELLDAPNIPKELLFQNLRELDFINKTLGGHAISLAGIKQLVKDKSKTYHIVDIGCGGGDALKQIALWARKNKFQVKLTGVDMNPDCIEFTKKACVSFSEIETVTMDYRDYLKSNDKVDIIHCALFCHHLKDNELVELFNYMHSHTKVGFVINDLQRHWLAYYSIKFLTRLLNGSTLVKNDAPLSVWRGFKKTELQNLLNAASVQSISIRWMWAFRFLILQNKNSEQAVG